MTNKTLSLALALVLSTGAVGLADAQSVGYNTRTGDVWVDNRLGEINDYGRQYREPFIGEMTSHYGAPRPLVVDLLDQRRWSPGDVYYACAIASALGVPCANVVREYESNPGQGWGQLAQRMGIKPGSPQFHALKRGTVNTYGRWGHQIAVDSDVRVDWARPRSGNSKASPGNAAPGAAATRAAPAKASPGAPPGQGKGNAGGKGSAGNPGKGDSRSGNPGKGQGKP